MGHGPWDAGNGFPRIASIRCVTPLERPEARSASAAAGWERAPLSPQRPIARCADAPFLLEDMGYGAMREREVWWLCPECGAAWRATVDARRAGAACPVCGHATAGTPAA